MGTWGTGLYADDTTCDVRDDFVKGLKQGLSGEESCQKILNRYGKLLDQPEMASLVYFALADTAWRNGHLTEQIKGKALSLLQSGENILAWERDAPRDAPARHKVLRNLGVRLSTPQALEKAVKVSQPKPKKVRTTAPIGSVFSLALPSGNLALLALVGYKELAESIDPVFSVPLWRGAALEGARVRISGEDSTLPFGTFHNQYLHVAILPRDERRSILSGLEPTNIKTKSPMPYRPESVVWFSVGRIAKEIDAHFDACGPK